MCDKRDMVITCAFRYDLYFPLMLSGLLQIRSVKKRLKILIGGKFVKTKLLQGHPTAIFGKISVRKKI